MRRTDPPAHAPSQILVSPFCAPTCLRLRITYLRLGSTGHSGKHGHEFLEFEYSHGRLRYANNSNYRNDSLIRKESAYTISFTARFPWFRRLPDFVRAYRDVRAHLGVLDSVGGPARREGAQAHHRV